MKMSLHSETIVLAILSFPRSHAPAWERGKCAAEANKRQEEFVANQAAYEARQVKADKEMSRLEKLVESITEQADKETRELLVPTLPRGNAYGA